MNQSRFERIIRSIHDTRDDEILCSDCFDHLSDYVDLEIGGGDAPKQMPRVRQHLIQCRVCREEYETLLDLARQDAA
ncbi:MAG: hypothetical protein KGJ80_13450 [Chloroflexota bacterium]|nr:hypothetical protein [Chloroflexota bacterium]